MGKKRIHELAKEKGWQVKDVVIIANELGIPAKNAMSQLNEENINLLVDKESKFPDLLKAFETKKEKIEADKLAAKRAAAKATATASEANASSTSGTSERTNVKQESSYQGNRDSGNRQSGGYQGNRDGGNRQGGGYQGNRDGGNRQGGGYQGNRDGGNRQGSGYQGNRDGGNRQGGGYQGNRDGGNRQGGGYQGNRDGGNRQGGGYQGNRDGGNRQGGGYQGNRDGGNRQGGGYQGNRDGGNRQGGGYQGNRDGGNRQGGGYQGNRDGGNRQQSGGFNNNNRKLEKQISEIKSESPAQAENRSRIKVEEKNRVTALAESEEKKSKKVLKEEQRREQLRIQEEARKEERRRQEAIRANQGPKVVKYTDSLTVGELSQKLGVPVAEIIKYLLGLGILATINHDLDADAIELIASEYDAEVEREETVDESDLDLFFEDEEDDSEEEQVTRPPVVTIMGHVDHGKTTLLDAIRDARVVEGEFGGITQHIGAYQVAHNGKEITFLDTPGHEAFTSMRARGAEVTDIAIIVVAADDGVMPQTKEAVEHALAANVPIIVAVNKMDKPGADPTRVMQGLTELGLQPEEWGGSTIYVKISAKKREGIDDLLEMIQLVAELHDYKANKNRRAIGTVIEARLDKGRGSVATLLVQAGTLNIGDPIVVGDTYGRVRTMENDLGKRIKTAGPSTPIELTGLVGVPSAGDKFVVFESEKKARQIGEQRATQQITEQRRKSSAMSLEDLNRQIVEGEVKEINVIVKADVQGSAEAVASSLAKIDIDGVRVKIVRSAVGAITESDVLLAVASNAIIYGFNVRPDANTRAAAEREGVEIRLHTIIYKAIEEMEAAMTGMLDPEFEEVVIGQIEVRETFKVSKIGTIAGGYVTDGIVKRDSQVRLIREGIIIYDGSLGSLKRFQNDAKEVSAGYECGLTIENYNDIKTGDVIEAYEMQEIKK